MRMASSAQEHLLDAPTLQSLVGVFGGGRARGSRCPFRFPPGRSGPALRSRIAHTLAPRGSPPGQGPLGPPADCMQHRRLCVRGNRTCMPPHVSTTPAQHQQQQLQHHALLPLPAHHAVGPSSAATTPPAFPHCCFTRPASPPSSLAPTPPPVGRTRSAQPPHAATPHTPTFRAPPSPTHRGQRPRAPAGQPAAAQPGGRIPVTSHRRAGSSCRG